MIRPDDRSISLSRLWQFRPEDRDDWQPLAVPGCWENLGLPHDWEGPGWYRRTVEIPEAWRGEGRRLWLRFGAVSYACTVWVNGVEVGAHIGAWDAFTLEVTEAVGDAAEAEILVRVIKPGGLTYPTKQTTAGFLPYVWGYLFGGIWQDVTLEVTGPVRLPEGLRLLARPDNGMVVLQQDEGMLPYDESERYELEILDAQGQKIQTGVGWAETNAPEPTGEIADGELCALVPTAENWSSETPALYTAVVRLYHHGKRSDEGQIRFGFRQVRVEGDTPLLNGVPFYPRMPLSWGWYPETLHCNPPVEMMRAELEKIRALGYNGVKCCLWVPPPAYLDLCDEMGMLVWLELPLWLPEMSAEQREHTLREYEAIVRQVRHHPCIVIWTLGCELSASCGDEFLHKLYDRVKELTESPLVRDNSGGGECYGGLLKEYADYYDYHFYCDLPFLRNTFDYFLPRWRPAQPWLFGEFCDADAFRDFVALREANGGELPWWAVADPRRNPQGARWDMNITGQWAQMERHNLFARREELKESQRRQTLLHRKFTVELVRSYREMSGYVITGLRDTPISIAGMFDDFGDFRYTPEEFRRFNADTVLFLGWHRRRNWVAGGDRPSYIDHWNHWSGDTLLPRIGISHYGLESTVAEARWELREASGRRIAAGILAEAIGSSLVSGEVRQLGLVELQAPTVAAMTRLLLRVTVRLETGETIENEWPLWIVPRPDWSALPAWAAYDPDNRLAGLERYGAQWENLDQSPSAPERGTSMLVASRWRPEIADFLRNGGRAFVFVDRGGGLPVVECPFWREAMKLFEPRPFWNAFPHEGFTDLNFYGLGPDCALDPDALADAFPEAAFRPLLRRVDARTFAVTDYLTEAAFPGGGRLLLTTLRPHGGLGDQPDGLLRHLGGVHFLASALKSLG